MKKRAPDPETLRRLRLGDLRRCFRHRYGYALPNDDAGRTDLYELLLPVSLGPTSTRIMANVIEVQAPWLSKAQAKALIERILAKPTRARWPSGKTLGQRLNLTNAERERLRLWTIHPADMTAAEMAEWRKAKKRARDERRRRQRGAKVRAASLAKTNPWQAEGISRATWFRRRQNGVRLISARQTLKLERLTVSRSLRQRPKRLSTAQQGRNGANNQ